MESGITIYSDSKMREVILLVVNKFSYLWINKGKTIHVSEIEFMKILLKDG